MNHNRSLKPGGSDNSEAALADSLTSDLSLTTANDIRDRWQRLTSFQPVPEWAVLDAEIVLALGGARADEASDDSDLFSQR